MSVVDHTIRAASRADLDVIGELEVAAGQRFREIGLHRIADDPGPSAENLAPHLDQGTIWVAELGGEIVGYAVASVVDAEGHLDQVSVAPGAAGLGIGRELIETVHAWASGAGFPTVTLTTFVDVPWNGPYYERLGYRIVANDELGPELASIRAAETAAGLDVLPRAAMRIDLAPTAGGSVRT